MAAALPGMVYEFLQGQISEDNSTREWFNTSHSERRDLRLLCAALRQDTESHELCLHSDTIKQFVVNAAKERLGSKRILQFHDHSTHRLVS